MTELDQFGEHRLNDINQAKRRCDKGNRRLAESDTTATMGGLALGQSVSDEDAETCTDKQPTAWTTKTCAAHKAKGNCEKSWFRTHADGYCHKTCGKCTPDPTPDPTPKPVSTAS